MRRDARAWSARWIRWLLIGSGLIGAATTAAPTGAPGAPAAADPTTRDTITVGEFGTIHLYRPRGSLAQVVLLISGDTGWNDRAIALASRLRDAGALVAGIDLPSYLRGVTRRHDACVNLGVDFERLSRLLQQGERLPQYHYPILVGDAAGGALTYALLNQAPKETFAGGLSIASCPVWPLAKPLCKGERLAYQLRTAQSGAQLLPTAHMADPWVALQGDSVAGCATGFTKDFVSQIQGAHFEALSDGTLDLAHPERWERQFLAAYEPLTQAPQSAPVPPPERLADLPIVEVAASGPQDDTFAVLLTGDGGNTGMDREIAGAFAAQGRPVAVLNSLKYFWNARAPQQVATDVDRVMGYYAAKWNKDRVILIGYSQGADVLPFVLNRLPAESRTRVATAAAIGMSESAVFEFHFTNWLVDPVGVPTLPELMQLKGLSFTCIYGADERDSVCRKLPVGTARVVQLPGGHHFNGDYAAVARAVLAGVTGH